MSRTASLTVLPYANRYSRRTWRVCPHHLRRFGFSVPAVEGRIVAISDFDLHGFQNGQSRGRRLRPPIAVLSGGGSGTSSSGSPSNIRCGTANTRRFSIFVGGQNHPAPPFQKLECLQEPAELFFDKDFAAPPNDRKLLHSLCIRLSKAVKIGLLGDQLNGQVDIAQPLHLGLQHATIQRYPRY